MTMSTQDSGKLIARCPKATTLEFPNNEQKRSRASTCFPTTKMRALGGFFLLLLHISLSDATHRHQRRGLSPTERQELRTLLGDGLTECASCPNDDKLACSGTTITDDLCAPCATGQLWWPCNIPDECYCKDLAAAAAEAEFAAIAAAAEAEFAAAASESEAAAVAIVNEPNTTTPPCEIPLCHPGEYNLTKVVPYTNCTQWGSCTAGTPGSIQTCPPGQAYSTQISACNVLSLVICGDDPPCPTRMEGPTASPLRR